MTKTQGDPLLLICMLLFLAYLAWRLWHAGREHD